MLNLFGNGIVFNYPVRSGVFQPPITLDGADPSIPFLPLETPASGTFVPLTGISESFTLGSLFPNSVIFPSGNSETLTSGIIASSITKLLDGQTFSFSQGAVTPELATIIELVGQSETISQGDLGKTMSVSLTGENISQSTGSLIGSFLLSLFGQSFTTTQNTVSAVLNVVSGILGQTETLTSGAMSGNISKDLLGESYSSSLGNLDIGFTGTGLVDLPQFLVSGFGTVSGGIEFNGGRIGGRGVGSLGVSRITGHKSVSGLILINSVSGFVDFSVTEQRQVA